MPDREVAAMVIKRPIITETPQDLSSVSRAVQGGERERARIRPRAGMRSPGFGFIAKF